MSKQTIKRALAVIRSEVAYHAGSDTHYRAEKLDQSLATLRALLKERDALEAENERLRAEIERLREVLKEADDELDRLDEDMDTCDHSVGVCTCDYWNMRRKMKAARREGKT